MFRDELVFVIDESFDNHPNSQQDDHQKQMPGPPDLPQHSYRAAFAFGGFAGLLMWNAGFRRRERLDSFEERKGQSHRDRGNQDQRFRPEPSRHDAGQAAAKNPTENASHSNPCKYAPGFSRVEDVA